MSAELLAALKLCARRILVDEGINSPIYQDAAKAIHNAEGTHVRIAYKRDDVRDFTDADLSRLNGVTVIEFIDESPGMSYAETGLVLDRWAAARSARIATSSYRLGQEIRNSLAGEIND